MPVPAILRRAEQLFGHKQIVTRRPDKSFHRYSYADFAKRTKQLTLALKTPGTGLEGSIYAGLTRLTESFLAREWPRDDGAVMHIERCLIDANWGNSTDVVYQFCRESQNAALVVPSHCSSNDLGRFNRQSSGAEDAGTAWSSSG